MNNKSTILDLIIEQGMLPLFFHKSEKTTLEITKTVYDAGIRVIEYTNRGKEALSNFIALKKEVLANMPGLKLGIGTIKTSEEAQQFIDAGADFIVCPTMNPEVADKARTAGLSWVPGCMTPTEIAAAQKHGAALIKLFPANVLGPGFISAVKSVFSDQDFMPTGGVEIEEGNLKGWFKAGACAVGMGSKLITNEMMANREFDKLTQNITKALELIKQSR